MKTLSQNIRSGFVLGFSALVTIIVGGTIYAQVNNIWTNPSELEASSGNSLSSENWNKILSNQNVLSNLVEGALAVPKGGIIAFSGNSCPDGWLPADGNGGRVDLRGVFIRGANNFGTGNSNRDSDRATAGSGVLTYQDDAIREITGKLTWRDSAGGVATFGDDMQSGAFRTSGTPSILTPLRGSVVYTGLKPNLEFRASYSDGVIIGSDNRPKNVALIYCVKN